MAKIQYIGREQREFGGEENEVKFRVPEASTDEAGKPVPRVVKFWVQTGEETSDNGDKFPVFTLVEDAPDAVSAVLLSVRDTGTGNTRLQPALYALYVAAPAPSAVIPKSVKPVSE